MEPTSSCPLDSRRMEMLHALLPYIPLTMQKFLNIYIGFEELLKAIRIIQNGPLTPPVVHTEKPQDLLEVLRGLCTPKENEMIDMIFNMNKMMSVYDSYKDMFDMFGGSGAFDFSAPSNSEQKSATSPPANQPSANPFTILNQMNQFRNTSEVDDLFQNFMT